MEAGWGYNNNIGKDQIKRCFTTRWEVDNLFYTKFPLNGFGVHPIKIAQDDNSSVRMSIKVAITNIDNMVFKHVCLLLGG